MKPNDKQPVLTGPILTKWVPHEENNVENPRATLMRFGKWQGQKLEEVDKNYLRTFKKYRTNSSERETAESKWLRPLLHYHQHHRAKAMGAKGSHQNPTVQKLNQRCAPVLMSESPPSDGIPDAKSELTSSVNEEGENTAEKGRAIAEEAATENVEHPSMIDTADSVHQGFQDSGIQVSTSGAAKGTPTESSRKREPSPPSSDASIELDHKRKKNKSKSSSKQKHERSRPKGHKRNSLVPSK